MCEGMQRGGGGSSSSMRQHAGTPASAAPDHQHPPACPPAAAAAAATPQVVLKAIQPYTRVRIPFIAQQLNVPAADVEQLLISLILDGRIEGRIDQVQQVGGCGWVCRLGVSRAMHALPAALPSSLLPTSPAPPRPRSCSLHRTAPHWLQLLELDVPLDQAPKYSALDKWAQQVQSLHNLVVAKLAV